MLLCQPDSSKAGTPWQHAAVLHAILQCKMLNIGTMLGAPQQGKGLPKLCAFDTFSWAKRFPCIRAPIDCAVPLALYTAYYAANV